jgi:hypothetical protein
MRAVHWVLRASLGLWGLAVAIGAMPGLQRKAGPDDLPGALPAAGLASSGPILQFAIAILLPFLTILAAQRVIPLLAERRWAAWTFSALLATAPITLMHYGTLRHVVMHGLAAAGIVFARRLEPRFSRADVLLVPCVLNFYFAFLDTKFGRTPAATFFRAAIVLLALRLIVGVLSKQRRPGVAFALAPAAFVFQMHWLQPNVAGIVALLWLIGTPLLLGKFDEVKVMRVASWSALPLAAAAFPLALIGAASLPPLDFFEDGHSLLPASEMARGELPYRDVIPMHGLLSDGVLDLWAMQAIRPDLGAILTSRRFLAALTAAAIYCTALAVTTSAELALLATFLSLAIFPAASLWPRAVLPLFALAAAAAGTRLRNRKLFAAAGALVVLSALFSLDLALCSAAISLIAALRMRAFVPWAIGALAIKIPLLVAIAIAGFLPSFITTTLFEVLGNGGVYVIGTLDLPHGLRTLAEVAGAVSHPEIFAMLMWFVALIGASAVLAKSPWKGSRRDAVWLVAGWIILAGAAWVLRRHHYFAFPLAAFLTGAIVALRRRSRPAAIALTVALAFFAKPFALVFDLSSPLRRSGGLDVEGWQEYTPLPRARGAIVDPLTHKGLGAAQRFLSTLEPHETFYDFANAATLYFLFNRNCPIRQVEVAMYESEEAQRNVIATLERNRNVKAALMIFPTAYSNIDGVSNRDRAPLVAKYLEQHFQPAFEEEGVVFWTRKKR